MDSFFKITARRSTAGLTTLFAGLLVGLSVVYFAIEPIRRLFGVE